MAGNAWTREEFMAAALAREVRDGEQSAVGTISPIPASAVLLAHYTHAPQIRPIIITSEDWWPFRGGSKEFYDFAQKGRLDLFFLSGGQIDRHGNLNTIAIGSVEQPRLRLPGGAGSAMLYYLPRRVVVFRAEHSPRIFVEQVDVVNAPGSTAPNVARPGGPWKVVTPLCVFRFDPAVKVLRLESLHPGVSREELQSKTGFPVEASSATPITPGPTAEQLRVLRERVRPEVAKVYPRFVQSAFLAA
jgi:glutaconate CoA-transferase subunit B